MMKIQVVSYNQTAPGKLMLAVFGETGGTIGRGEGNLLILPDENRHISRVHATVSCRTGRFFITDQGSATPVCVNGKALGKGNESSLNDGDEIRIGPYVLSAKFDQDETPTDVFMPKSVTAHAIPDDFDPFSALTAGAAQPIVEPEPIVAPAASVQQMPDLGPKSQEPSIDLLFGLQPGSQNDPLGLNYGAGKQEVIPELDPLRVLDGAMAQTPVPARPVQRDDTPELQRAFVPPVVSVNETPITENHRETQKVAVHEDPEPSWPFEPLPSKSETQIAEPEKKEPEKVVTPSLTPATNEGMLLSWENNATDSQDALVQSVNVDPPVVAHQEHTTEPAEQVFDVVLDLEDTRPIVVPAPVETHAAQTGADTAAINVQLLQAFLSGAGVEDLEIRDGLTPELMQHLGQLLRETVQGTIDLLLARALVKNEFRADMTMISAQNNNPLKFSPNVEVALAQLLKPQTRGFMPPLTAVKDAFNDLRSHQFGVMTGMQAALEGVLQQLDPAQLEHRLKQKNMLDSVLPMNRKAKLWDLFVEHYKDIVQEAEEDFHSLFGKAFVRAYQAQLDSLNKEKK